MQIDAVKSALIEAYGADAAGVQVAAAPYRACPLGAHIDHQGGPVTAVALQLGVLLAFAPQDSPQVVITSRDFEGQVGVAFLLAFEKANDLAISAEENIELD
eukprot:gene13314-15734_t